MPFANRIDLTSISGQYDGDTFFPEIDNAIWKKTGIASFDNFEIFTYQKI